MLDSAHNLPFSESGPLFLRLPQSVSLLLEGVILLVTNKLGIEYSSETVSLLDKAFQPAL